MAKEGKEDHCWGGERLSYHLKSQSSWILNLTKLKGAYYLGMRWVDPRASHLVGRCCATELYTSSKGTHSPSCVCVLGLDTRSFIPGRED